MQTKVVNNEEKIIYINELFYVYEVNKKLYEVRKHNGTHSYVVGSGSDPIKCIRTAKRLTKYPINI